MDRPAAWHPDPAGQHDHRWWDGQRWTEHVADAGVASVDPLPDAPPASATDTTASEAGGTASDRQDAASGSEPGGATEARAEDGPVWERTTPDTGGASHTQGTSQQAGSSEQPTSQLPWGAQQPTGQQPWGDAPSAAPSWSQQPAWQTAGGGSAAGASGLAVGSLVTGILSLPLLIAAGLGGLLGIVALVLGIIAVRKANRGEAGGKGMAIGGIVTGAISIVFGIMIGIFIFTFGLGIVEEMEACLEETGGDQQECEDRLEDQILDRFTGNR